MVSTGVDQQLAQALRHVAAATRSGHSLQESLGIAGARRDDAVGVACRSASAQLALGASIGHSLDQFAHDVGGGSARLFAQVIGVQHRRGGDLGNLCHRLARLLHERGRLRDEARSATAQARFTANAVLALPALLALGLAWLAPDLVSQFANPGVALLSMPAAVLLVVGVLVIRRVAIGSLHLDISVPTARPTSRLIAAVGGTGSVRSQGARLAVATAGLMVPLVALGSGPLVVVCAVGATVGAALLPRLRERDRRARLDLAASSGLPNLLELSIALLAAGATPHEVLTESIECCPGALGEQLRAAGAQIALGRSPVSAISSLEIVERSPELEAWAFALTDGSRLGAPASAALEILLRDARAVERERFRRRAATAGPRIQLATVLLIVPAILWLMLVAAGAGLVTQLHAAGILA